MSGSAEKTEPRVEIDCHSGFCFGVVTAIRKAEELLDRGEELYCLGDIVHNSNEVERLRRKGLKTINHSDLSSLRNVKVLLRAHGEPPSTYRIARERDIEIIDATCPVVLQLQRRIKRDFEEAAEASPLILIYGKEGHAEVNGLVGQTGGEAIVIQDESQLDDIDLTRDIFLYSQTTKSLEGFRDIVEAISKRKKEGAFHYFDTICRQVSGRMENLRKFAADHEAIVFVCGSKSSNGKVLFEECRKVNPRSQRISSAAELDPTQLTGVESIGICGATSTPSWLMNEVKDHIETLLAHQNTND